jgi:hypothetical protein
MAKPAKMSAEDQLREAVTPIVTARWLHLAIGLGALWASLFFRELDLPVMFLVGIAGVVITTIAVQTRKT